MRSLTDSIRRDDIETTSSVDRVSTEKNDRFSRLRRFPKHLWVLMKEPITKHILDEHYCTYIVSGWQVKCRNLLIH